MNNFEINKQEMGHTVYRFGQDNQEALSIAPSVPPLFARLGSVLERVGKQEGELTINRKGVTESKMMTKDELIDTALEHYGQLYNYADEIGEVELRSFADVSEHELQHVREGKLAEILRPMLDKFDLINKAPVKPELAKYDLSLEVKAQFGSEIDSFENRLTDVGKGRTEKSSARITLTELFKEMDHVLTLLDKSMLKFKKSNPELYQKYTSARVIINRGGGHGGTDDTPPDNPPA